MKTKEKLEHIKYQLDERLNKRLKNRSTRKTYLHKKFDSFF